MVRWRRSVVYFHPHPHPQNEESQVGRVEGGTYANDAVRSDKLDQLILMATLSIALTIGLEVTQVADVALLVAGSTVGLVVGVD
jgi:hypothetical protein